MRHRLRLICWLSMAVILVGCGGNAASNRWLFYLTAPTNVRFSPGQASASYDGMLVDLSNGVQKKVGQVTGTNCLEWSAVNQQFLQVVKNQIHLYDQNLRQVSSFSLKQVSISNGASWTPDGKRIVFSGETSDAPYGRENLFVMNKDGTNPHKLAFDVNKLSRSGRPVVSADGKQIAFVSNRDLYKKPGNELDYDLFIMQLDGTDVDRVADSGSDELGPAWSPDGRSLAFVSNVPDTVHDSSVYNIYRFDLADRSIVQLTHNTNSLFVVYQWSPDGKAIVFTHRRVDLMQPQDETIATISMDGKTTKEIPCQEGFSCFCPQWIP